MTEQRDATPKPQGVKSAENQKRLSSALRENLKRRKAAPRPKKPEAKG